MICKSTQSSVRINAVTSDGLTGMLPQILFSLYLNDVVTAVKSLNIDVDNGNGEKLCILLYADDVLIADTQEQIMQGTLNASKSQVVHLRPRCYSRSKSLCGLNYLQTVDRYVYPSLLLTEHLDYAIIAYAASQFAARALGLLIKETRGDILYSVFTKLYDTMVCPVILY